jgi:ribonuclease HI
MLDSKKTPEECQADFYGPVYEESRNQIEVYTDGSCYDNGSPNARAGAGVYYGPASQYNMSLRALGQQTNNWGELLAILYVLSLYRQTNPSKYSPTQNTVYAR